MEVIIMILCKFFLLWRNKIIHIICIPLIAATLFSLLSYIPFNYTVDNLPVVGSYTVGFAEIFFVVAMVYYFSLSPLFGVKNIWYLIVYWRGFVCWIFVFMAESIQRLWIFKPFKSSFHYSCSCLDFPIYWTWSFWK